MTSYRTRREAPCSASSATAAATRTDASMVTTSAALGDHDLTCRPWIHGLGRHLNADRVPTRQPRLGRCGWRLDVRGRRGLRGLTELRQPTLVQLDRNLADGPAPEGRMSLDLAVHGVWDVDGCFHARCIAVSRRAV